MLHTVVIALGPEPGPTGVGACEPALVSGSWVSPSEAVAVVDVDTFAHGLVG